MIPNAGRDIASEPGHVGSEIDETPTNDVGGPMQFRLLQLLQLVGLTVTVAAIG